MKTLIKNILFVLTTVFMLTSVAFSSPINVNDVKYDNVNGKYLFHVVMDNSNVATGKFAELRFEIEELGISEKVEIVTIDDNLSHTFTYNLKDLTNSIDSLENGVTYTAKFKADGSEVSIPFLFGSFVRSTKDTIVLEGIKVDSNPVNGETIEVQNGENINLKLRLNSKVNIEDFDLSARIFGYEHNAIISTIEDPVTLTAGRTKIISLNVQLPNDMDSQKDYTIRISGGNNGVYFEKNFDLFVQTQRHRVDVLDLVMTPSSGVEAGQNIIANVRMKNRGQKSQDSVKVFVEIPELSVTESSYVSDLNSDEVATSDDMLLFIPETAEAGQYEVLVKLSYDDNYKETVATYSLNVLASDVEVTKKLMISFDDNRDLVANQANEFQVVVANPNTESKPVSIVSLDNVWADVEITPSLAMVKGGDSETFTVKVTPKSEIKGEKELSLIVKNGATDVSTFKVSTYVEGAKNQANSINWVNVGLAVLLIIAIIILLTLVISIAKRKDDNDEDDMSSTEEYY